MCNFGPRNVAVCVFISCQIFEYRVERIILLVFVHRSGYFRQIFLVHYSSIFFQSRIRHGRNFSLYFFAPFQ